MPSAGAVYPPVITPLRRTFPGKPGNFISTSTYIEIETETPDCRIYFSTDGSKPNPFQLKSGGRESTFRYRGPFTLRNGKRTVKTIAVSRNGLKESNVVTKTFQVEDAGLPSDHDFDSQMERDNEDTYRSENDFRPKYSHRPSSSLSKSKRQGYGSTNSLVPKALPAQAWAETPRTDHNNYLYDGQKTYDGHHKAAGHDGHHKAAGYDGHHKAAANNVRIPDGPFNPTNYSGTQVNFWGVAPNNLPALANGIGGGYSVPYASTDTQLGYMTNNMLMSTDQPKISMDDLRRLIQAEAGRQTMRQPVVEYVTKEPEFKAESRGNGDWKGQIEHIYAHLVERCQSNPSFRNQFAHPQLGKILHADFDEEDDSYLLTLAIAKAGHVAAKPKPTPHPPPVKTPPTPVPVKHPAKPQIGLKDVARAALVKPPVKQTPKPKETPKEEKLKKRDPFFETEEYKAEGTLKPWPAFNAEYDCEKLRKAMKGIGTDEKAIIDVLGYRTSHQRQEVVLSFKTMFGKDLAKELQSELSGNFLSCCKALCLPPDVYDASEVKRAIKRLYGPDPAHFSMNLSGAILHHPFEWVPCHLRSLSLCCQGLGTDEDALIEILCTRTNAQIKAINAAYRKEYNKELEKDVVDDTSGNFKKLLVAQIQGNRDESPKFDRTAAQDDAQALFKAGEGKWGTEESVFNKILCQRSFAYLRAVFEEYGKISKKTIEDAIKSEFSGDIKDGLITVVKVIRDKPGYFAEKLKTAMKGLGTDDDAVVRLFVSRSECDMVQIKKSFQSQFKGTLAEWIKGDTSGDYKEMLLALIGERAAPVPSSEEVEAQGEPELEEVEEEHIQRDGTLKSFDNFNVNADCEALKKAMKGLGTDEAAIIAIFGHRAIAQRLDIVRTYKTMFGKDLIAELKSEISGNFSHTITSLCKTPAERDADELRKAMKGIGTDEGCLIEILCTRSNAQLTEISQQFQTRHGKKLEEAIISETSGNLKRLLVSMLQANRPHGNTIDRRKARNDAKALAEAGEKKFGTDESRFNVILCSRSFPQLRATFVEYEKLTGKDIVKSIESEMSSDLKKGFLTIVGCIRSEATQFAKTLYESMHGLGTNDDSLIRTIVSRCEIDMVQIKQEFERNYQQPLGKYIKDDTSGDYCKLLLTLVGEESYIKK